MEAKHWSASLISVRKAFFWLMAISMVMGVLFNFSTVFSKYNDDETVAIKTITVRVNRVNGFKQRYQCTTIMVEGHPVFVSAWQLGDRFMPLYLRQMGPFEPFKTKNVLRL